MHLPLLVRMAHCACEPTLEGENRWRVLPPVEPSAAQRTMGRRRAAAAACGLRRTRCWSPPALDCQLYGRCTFTACCIVTVCAAQGKLECDKGAETGDRAASLWDMGKLQRGRSTDEIMPPDRNAGRSASSTSCQAGTASGWAFRWRLLCPSRGPHRALLSSDHTACNEIQRS